MDVRGPTIIPLTATAMHRMIALQSSKAVKDDPSVPTAAAAHAVVPCAIPPAQESTANTDSACLTAWSGSLLPPAAGAMPTLP